VAENEAVFQKMAIFVMVKKKNFLNYFKYSNMIIDEKKSLDKF
jgi:hypothetical protein